MQNTDTTFDGKAQKQRTTFRMEVAVGIHIDASASRIWSLLTDASGFPSWNSTVTHIDGSIENGSRIQLKSTLAPDRTFKLKVSEMVEAESMVWSDGMMPMFRGQRRYTLSPTESGTRFRMVEVFRGIMLPMIAKHLHDFGPNFETFAADLKTAAEKASKITQ